MWCPRYQGTLRSTTTPRSSPPQKKVSSNINLILGDSENIGEEKGALYSHKAQQLPYLHLF